VRVCFLPINIKMFRATAETSHFQPIMASFQTQMNTLREQQKLTPEKQRELSAALEKELRSQGFSATSAFAPLLFTLISLPVYSAMFFGLYHGAFLPGFDHGGPLWHPNLGVPFPSYLKGYIGLPGALAGITYVAFRMGADSGGQAVQGLGFKILVGVSLLTPLFTNTLNAGVLIYLSTNLLWSVVLGAVFRQKRVRALFNIKDLVVPKVR